MTDIKVILDTEPTFDLTADERIILFEQIASENPALPTPTVQAFAEMREAEIAQATQLEQPTLLELIIKRLVDLSRGFGSKYNTLIMPIIEKAAESEYKAATVRQNVAKSLTGGAQQGAVRIRFDYPVAAYLQTGLDYISASNEDLQIVGIVVNKRCDPDIGHLIIEPTSAAGKLHTGRYIASDLLTTCEEILAVPSITVEPGRYMFSKIDNLEQFLAQLLRQLRAYYQLRLTAADSLIFNQLKASAGKSTPLAAALATTVAPTVIELAPEQPRPEILNDLESVHNGRFYNGFTDAVIADAYNRGLADTYNLAALNGRDSEDTRAKIREFQALKKRALFLAEARQRQLTEQNNLGVYRQLIERKIGHKRLAEIDHALQLKPSLTAKASNILSLLKPAEKSLIEIEYKKHSEYLEAYINNKCPHIKALAIFRAAVERRAISGALAKLLEFVKPGTPKGHMHACKLCGFDILCPHVQELTELEIAGKSSSEIRAALTKYAAPSVAKDQIHCNICGELLSNLDAFDEGGIAVEPLGHKDEELSQFIWSEIISNVKYLKFQAMIDVRTLVSSARDACYPFIFEIEKQIIKSKTNTIDEIRSKKRLYVTIYAFAYFIHLMIHNKGKVAFKDLAPSKIPKNEVVDMIKHAIELILLSKNVIIRAIPGMTPDGIKNLLIDAYKSITTIGAQTMAHTGDVEAVASVLLLDPVYKYYYAMNTRGRAPTSQFDIVDKLEEIMGGPLKVIEKREDMFDGVRRPKLDSAAFKSPEFEPQKLAEVAKLQRAYAAASFELFDQKVRDRIWAEYVYTGEPEEATFRQKHDSLDKEFAQFAEREVVVRQYRGLLAAQPYSRVEFGTMQWKNNGAGLGRIFDDQGRPHRWTLFIAEGHEPMTAIQIAQLREKGQVIGPIIDKKCATCGALRSEAGASDASIKESQKVAKDITNFYIFYENRCPEGAVHEMTGDSCANCGYKPAFAKQKDPQYYTKYSAKYAEERGDIASYKPSEQPLPAKLDKIEELDGWVFNFNAVMELCQRVDINYKLVMALGAYEKQEYNDIKSGEYIPPEAEERTTTRIIKLDAFIKRLITEYNQLRSLAKIPRPPQSLLQLVEASGVNKHKLAEMTAAFPDIGADYTARYYYVRQTHKPRDIVSFCIQELCARCAVILDHKHEESAALRKNFVAYILKKIIRGEELITTPGYFNWSVLYGEAQEREDSNFVENPDSEIDPKESAQDDFGDTGAPLSNNDLDIDVDPDADPEDEGNGWKVGENYGLT